jgi:hypothetical protein
MGTLWYEKLTTWQNKNPYKLRTPNIKNGKTVRGEKKLRTKE